MVTDGANGQTVGVATVGTLVGAYVNARRGSGELSSLTSRGVWSTLTSLADYVGWDAKPTSLTTRKIENWLARLPNSPSTKRRKLSEVRTWCRWLQTRGYIRRDPSIDIRGPREPRRQPRNMRPEWVAAILHECDDFRDECIVILMVQEGLRCVEVANLQVGDLDLAGGTMRVVGKFGDERELPITAQTRDALGRYLRQRPARAGPLIRSYQFPDRPLSPGYISRRISVLSTRAGVRQSPHDGRTAHALRHTAATDVVDHGGDVRDVQTMLGHQSLATSSRYIARAKARRLHDVMDGRWYGLRVGVPLGREFGVEFGYDADDGAGPSGDEPTVAAELEGVFDVEGSAVVGEHPASEAEGPVVDVVPAVEEEDGDDG